MQMLSDILCVGESANLHSVAKLGFNFFFSLFLQTIPHRALQIPPEAWLRFSLNHASITWISIQPSGRVTMRLFGDSGHIPAEYVTSR